VKLAQYLQRFPHAYDLSFIARGETLKMLRQQGVHLQIQSAADQVTEIQIAPINVYERYAEIDLLSAEQLTIVFLCTKSKDTLSAARDIATQVTSNTVAVSMQNGVENEAQLASVLGQQAVMGAYTNIAASVIKPGCFLQKGNYSAFLGELDGQKSTRVTTIIEQLQQADINAQLSTHIYEDLWSKLVWNAAFNPTSVLYEMTVGELLADPAIRQRIGAIMQEVVQVAAACGYTLAADVVNKHITRTDKAEWVDFRTSMLQDFQRGTAIELDALLGVVVRQAKAHDVSVPHAEKLLAELQRKLQRNR